MADPGPRPGKARAAAARAVTAVLVRGRSLDDALPPEMERLDPRDRPLAQEIAYGTLRWHPRLAAVLQGLLQKPLRRKDRDLEAVLLTGLYQLAYLDVPPHAAVSETVAAAGGRGRGWAKGLVNGVLRNFLREREERLQRADRDEAAALAHPAWLLGMLRKAWPEDWRAVAEANNARPPMTLRVNAARTARADYLEELAAAGLAARPGTHSAEAVVLERPVPVERLPGFEEGRVSVQDEAAQLAAGLLDPGPGERVLDACAAPGGKTAHLLERQPGLDLVALDLDADRLERVAANLARLGLAAERVTGDAGAPDGWWDGRPFDRILLDAPCTGTGVIRRHPDIKALRRPEDVEALVGRQAKLLAALWPLLRPGGMLVYSTCSVLPRENARQVAAFLHDRDDAVEVDPVGNWGHPQAAGRQILPGEDGMDGFYYACLRKQD